MVRLYDAHGDLLLELANESHPDYQDVYSRARASASLKLAPDELMGELIVDLDRLEFETLSGEGPPPAGHDVRGWVEIRQNRQDRTFVIPARDATGEVLAAFANMKLVIDHYYKHIGGLQFIDNPAGAAIFRRPQ